MGPQAEVINRLNPQSFSADHHPNTKPQRLVFAQGFDWDISAEQTFLREESR